MLSIGPDERSLALEIVAIVEPGCPLVIQSCPTTSPEQVMSRKYIAGLDIDLDVEIVKDKQGRRMTERRGQDIAAETLPRPASAGPR